MQNINLNAGGLIGALSGAILGGGGITFVCVAFQDTPKPEDWAMNLGVKAFIGGLILGSFAGNALWAKLYPPLEPPKNDAEDNERYY